MIELFVNTEAAAEINDYRNRMLCESRTIQPKKLDRTDPVKSAASESAIQYRSHTDSDLPWTVRQYMSISKRKRKMLHKWCGARNSAVSGWHWLLLAVNQ